MKKQAGPHEDNQEVSGNKPQAANENAKKGGGNPPGKKGSLGKRLSVLAFFLILAAGGILLYWYFNLRGFVSTDDAFIDGDRVAIASSILGRITALQADEGDPVTKGQLLVKLDDADLQAQKLQAEANLELAHKNVTLAKVSLQKAEDDYKRATTQFKNNIITEEEYTHITKARDAARAQYEIELARVKAADAQLNVVRTQLEKIGIKAPITGVIAKRWVLAGDVIQPGQPVFTIYDNDHIWITANFEETKLASIRTGAPVEISVDAYSHQKFEGKVMMIMAAAASQFSLIPPNNASGNFTKVTQRVPVRISILRDSMHDREEDPILLPGMSVVVKVKVDNQ